MLTKTHTLSGDWLLYLLNYSDCLIIYLYSESFGGNYTLGHAATLRKISQDISLAFNGEPVPFVNVSLILKKVGIGQSYRFKEYINVFKC